MGKTDEYFVSEQPNRLTDSTMVLTPELNGKSKKISEMKDVPVDPEVLCGFGPCTPSWLQKYATPKLFLVVYSLCGIVQGAQFTYIVGCMTTMEKRFSYDSKMSGLIMIADEISPIILGVFVGYFGGVAHRPRLVTLGLIIGSLSSFVLAAPYLLYGSAESAVSTGNVSSKVEFCDKDHNSSLEVCTKSATTPAVCMFIFGNFLKGICGLVFYTIGTSYLDDGVKKKNSPYYFGTLLALRLLGPTCGFLLSSLCLQYYENPFHDPGFDQTDPRWIGAWWLGFIILGVAILIFSIPMILFPRRFPNHKLPASLANKKKKPELQESPLQQLKGMGKAMKRLGKNPILICHYLGGVFRLNGVVGYYVLLPKYMEMQFRQSASKASLYSGPASIIGMQIGILLGGILIRKFKPKPRVLTGGIMFAESFSVMALICCMFITCPIYQMSGTHMMDGNRLQLQNECNMNCSCGTKVFTPVCGPDGVSTYFSPCYAGCTGHNKTEDTEIFTDCKCVHDESNQFTLGTVLKNYCDSDCQWLVTFIVILSLGKLLSSTARVGNTIVTLRCVDPEDKSIALGALNGVFSLLAFIPYPLIYGALTDASCLVWEESCGKTGNCWIYDADKFRFLLHGVSAGFVFLGCITDVLVWYLSPRLQGLYDDNDDESKKEPTDEDIRNAEIINNGGILGVMKTGLPNGSLNSPNGVEAKEKVTTM